MPGQAREQAGGGPYPNVNQLPRRRGVGNANAKTVSPFVKKAPAAALTMS